MIVPRAEAQRIRKPTLAAALHIERCGGARARLVEQLGLGADPERLADM